MEKQSILPSGVVIPEHFREELEEIRRQQLKLNERITTVDAVMGALKDDICRVVHCQDQMDGRVTAVESEVSSLKKETRELFRRVRAKSEALMPTLENLINVR